jgi:hypothetical protein
VNEPYDEQGRPDEATSIHPTPADEAEQGEVSRLLAAVSGPPSAEPMPPEVATRLDDVLAGLVAERTPTTAGVTDLSQRRRRRWPALLAAAAAVSVVGLGVGNVLDLGGGADMEAVTAEDGSAPETLESADGAGSAGSAADEAPEDTADRRAVEESAPLDGKVAALAEMPRLRRDSLTIDVQRLEDFDLDGDSQRQRALRRACVQPDLAEGDEWLSVRLDGDPAVLVLRAPDGGRRTAEVFGCDEGDTPVAQTTVEAR